MVLLKDAMVCCRVEIDRLRAMPVSNPSMKEYREVMEMKYSTALTVMEVIYQGFLKKEN